MSKLMQKLVFFIEPDTDYKLPSIVGNLYMNRFGETQPLFGDFVKFSNF